MKTLIKSIDEGISPILIHGSEPQVIKWVAAKVNQSLDRPVVVLFEDEHKARTAAEEYEEAVYLPSRELVWFDTFAHSNQVAIDRVEALATALSTKAPVIFASVNSLVYRYPTKLSERLLIDLSTEIPLADLQKKLYMYGYERVEIVESKGQYSLRGGIFDVFSPLYERPFRIEFFGDEVDSIRDFDIETQKSVDKFETVWLYPAREMVLSDERIETAIQALKSIKGKYKQEKRERIEEMIEHLTERVFVDGIERYFPFFFEHSMSLLDWFEEPVVFLVGNNQCVSRMNQFLQDYRKQFSDYLERGEVISEQYKRVFEFEEIKSELALRQLVSSELLIKHTDGFEPSQIVKLTSREMNKYFGKFDQIALDLRKWKIKGYHILIAFTNEDRMMRFIDAMNSFEVTVNQAGDADRVMSGQAIAIMKPFSSGFYFDTFKGLLLTEAELYGEGKKISRKKPAQGKVIKAFSELSVGDFVVHESHGVGQYLGIEQMKIDQTRKDFLKLRYAQDDYLYIPVESAGLVQKYMGTDAEKLKLNRLGGQEWKKTKSRAKKAIEDMTDELIALYASRREKKGYAFSSDNDWQREFEALFPYQETRDQLKCIDEIKFDMEKAEPMERLLCGDVGYGKTEVAIRAAFKAVLDSKQVAILVPTTILAQQHFKNISERFSKYPANIQMISRFRTKAEQAKIIKDLKSGVVDVVVGTHRILSNDVVFKDLGLLVIDEEQRFGVKHKEKIKQMKENIDVLTLTATPIPRTLHMSMIGIRDMSVIEDPPEDRYPIQTYVVEFDENLVREAIARELERGGQVYFVHNRIEDIDRVAAKIQELVPEALVHYAHGQMNEHQLERLMVDFMNNDFNVLVSTTIIETGLDISNVNTIIINDGDRFGLSQLYQLRGRVGRSNRLAYCYIFYQENKVLSEIAEKRLKAIKEFTELGAGFKIAMRDLEIRGAGNVLGTEQHGYMEAIGYDLYCKLLEESVLHKKGEVVKEKPQAKIDFAVNAFIPENYISNHQLKIEIYKKIAAIESRKDLEMVYEEIEDRFGTVPTSVDNLIKIAFIKALSEAIGVEEVSEDGSAFTLKFAPNYAISPLFISQVLDYDNKNVSFFAGNPALLKVKITNRLRKKEEQLTMLEMYLEKIYSFHSEYLNI
ncbi:MAG: transcription-repair coupling factor [Clostridiales bacterium 38-18]|nr:MAG: transcription-repair coupling factor [Clostridiales bacterium 38-18]